MELLKKYYNKEKITILLVTVITSMIVHFALYASSVTGPDTLLNSMYHRADIWETMLLRFGLFFVQIIKGNVVSPILATLLSSILLGITVNVVLDIFNIKNKYFKYITAVVFAVAPNISSTLTFFYCSDAYLLGLLFATLAVYIIRKYENKNWLVIISGLLLALAIGMYQTYLSVTMVLCVATLLIDVLNNKEKKKIFITLFKYIVMGIIGVIMFYLIAHVVLLIRHLHASSYSGADSIGLGTLLQLPNLLPQAYKSFFNYYFNDEIIPNTIWKTNILYIVIFTIAVISTIYIIIENRIYKKITNMILALIFILIAPICFGIIEITVPDVDIHILMACSMIYIFPIFFKLLEMLPKTKLVKNITYIMVFSSILVIWNYTWQDNASYVAMKAMQNQTESTVSRIVTRIEELEGYNSQMPVLFLGGLENNEYLNKANTDTEARKIYDRTWGFIANKSTLWWGNMDSWRKILYEYEGVNIKLVNEHESSEIFETEEYKNMKYYPEKDSIKIINETVVVKLSD